MRYCDYRPQLMTISETAVLPERDESHMKKKKMTEVTVSQRQRHWCTKQSEVKDKSQRRRSTSEPSERRQSTATQLKRRSHSSPASLHGPSPTPIEEEQQRQPHSQSRIALHKAVRRGNLPLICELLRQRPQLVAQPDQDGNLPLHHAAIAHTPYRDAVVHLLLEAGAPVNAQNRRQHTPLQVYLMTTKDDDDTLVQLLLRYGADTACSGRKSFTTLAQFAAARSLSRVAAVLSSASFVNRRKC